MSYNTILQFFHGKMSYKFIRHLPYFRTREKDKKQLKKIETTLKTIENERKNTENNRK